MDLVVFELNVEVHSCFPLVQCGSYPVFYDHLAYKVLNFNRVDVEEVSQRVKANVQVNFRKDEDVVLEHCSLQEGVVVLARDFVVLLKVISFKLFDVFSLDQVTLEQLVNDLVVRHYLATSLVFVQSTYNLKLFLSRRLQDRARHRTR